MVVTIVQVMTCLLYTSVLGLDEEVSGSHVGGDHIEGLVLLVIADGWCEDAG